MNLIAALLLGFVAGLRSMTAIAAASWAARLGLARVSDTPVAFMGFRYTPVIFTILALGELGADKLPSTPSRKQAGPFVVRIICGALAGATCGASGGSLVGGLIFGGVGAVAGTLGGAALRARLAAQFGRDLPAALLEDALTILLAIIAITQFL